LDRCALFVDAGYALAEGALAVHGTRNRASVSWDYAGLLKLLGGLSRDRTGLPLLRCYWYDTADGGRATEHDTLADVPGLKLRLSKIRPSRKEGVEAEIRKDLSSLARNRAVSDAVIVSAEEDLAPVIAEIQDLGIRVVLLHISSDGNWGISRSLRQECDDIIDIAAGHLRPFVDLIPGAEPGSRDAQLTSSGYRGLESGSATASAPAHVMAQQQHAIAAPVPQLYPSPVAPDYERAGLAQIAAQARDPQPGQSAQDAQRRTDDQQQMLMQQYQAQEAGRGPGIANGAQSHSAGYPQSGFGLEPAGVNGQGRPVSGAASQPGAGQPSAPQHVGSGPHGIVPGGMSGGGAAQNGLPPGGMPNGTGLAASAPNGQAQGGFGLPAGQGNGQVAAQGVPANGQIGGQGQHAPMPLGPGLQQQGMQPGAGMQPGLPGGMPGQGLQLGAGMQPSHAGPQPGQPGQGMQQGLHPGQPGQGMQQGLQPGQPGQGMQQGLQPGQPGQGMQQGLQPGQPAQGMQQGLPRQNSGQGPAPGQAGTAQNGLAPLDQQRGLPPSRHLPSGNGLPYPPPDRPGQFGAHAAQFSGPPGNSYSAASYSGPQQAVQVPQPPPPIAISIGEAVQSAHAEGFGFGEAVARDAPALWLEAVLARKPRMPSDLEARLLQGSALPIDSLLHDEVRHALRRGFWDALERSRH
jgi:NYN domain